MDGINSFSKNCMRNYQEQKREKKKFLDRKRRKTDTNFRLISNIRSRICKSMKCMSTPSSTKDSLGLLLILIENPLNII